MSESNVKGDIGEAAFVFYATKNGYWVGKMPQDCPYDFVMDDKQGNLKRVQVKYRTIEKNGSVRIKIENNTFTNRTSYTEKNIDLFAVYISDLEKVYLIPINECIDVTEVSLRVERPKNGQTKGVRLLEDYIAL